MKRRQVVFGGALALCGAGLVRADFNDIRIARYGEPLDVANVPAGGWCVLLIDSTVIFVRHRTPEEITIARETPLVQLADPMRDEERARDAEWLVVSGECTHAGCSVIAGQGAYRGWECFCHGSQYDISGRVRHGPAKRNLAIIPYEMTDLTILVLHAP
jgi:ubiquinol-cytochrome c reductase iron-sulfur subunit